PASLPRRRTQSRVTASRPSRMRACRSFRSPCSAPTARAGTATSSPASSGPPTTVATSSSWPSGRPTSARTCKTASTTRGRRGASTSAAYVAGLAAFMKAVDPTLSNGVIVGRIARNADPAGRQDQTGNGRINMPRALADTSTEFIEPAGAAPVGNGGPFVGPYQAAASLTVTCSPNPVALNSSTTCTAQEGGSNGHNINWTVSPSGSGTFSPTSCKMGPPNSNNQCSVIYTATSLGNGSQTITATDTSNGNLQGTAALTVIGPAAKLAFTTNPSLSSTAGGAV